MTLRVGSLCSGFGGLDLSVESVLDAELAWYAQYEPPHKGKPDRHQYAARIMAHHFPGVPNHGDITAIDYTSVEPVDIVIGGYPCQGQSVAGKQLGENDPRWLWPHVARAVRALRPPLVFFENVRNHLRIGFDTVLGDLADLGYDVAWTTLKASAVGAPHPRDRLFILGVAPGTGHAAFGFERDAPSRAGGPLAVRRGGAWLEAYESLVGPVAFSGDLPESGIVRDDVLAALEVVTPEVPGGRLQQRPTGNLGSNGGSQHPDKRRSGGHGPTLADELEHLDARSRRSPGELLPTPRVSDANGVGSHGTGGPDLRTVVSLLPTPTGADSRGTRNRTSGRKPGSKHHDGTTLCDAVVVLRTGLEGAESSPGRAESAGATPRARDWKNGGKDGLEEALRRSPAALLPTPRASDGAKGGPNQRGSSGDLMLPSAVTHLAPATAATDCGCAAWGQYQAAIHRWEVIQGRTAPEPTEESAKGNRVLSPAAVEFMMGLPAGWVTAVPGVPRNPQLHALGNGVVPRQAATALRSLLAAFGGATAPASCLECAA